MRLGELAGGRPVQSSEQGGSRRHRGLAVIGFVDLALRDLAGALNRVRGLMEHGELLRGEIVPTGIPEPRDHPARVAIAVVDPDMGLDLADEQHQLENVALSVGTFAPDLHDEGDEFGESRRNLRRGRHEHLGRGTSASLTAGAEGGCKPQPAVSS